MNEIKKNFIEIDKLTEEIKKNIKKIEECYKNIDKLGLDINTTMYDQKTAQLMNGTTSLKEYNIDQFYSKKWIVGIVNKLWWNCEI